jgi:hypothetical protein
MRFDVEGGGLFSEEPESISMDGSLVISDFHPRFCQSFIIHHRDPSYFTTTSHIQTKYK